MDRVFEQFYNILKSYFSNSEASDDYSENADELKAIARDNMCTPFFCGASSRFNIDVNEELKQGIIRLVSHNYKNLTVQNVILNKLFENNIRCAILKGTSVSVNYPDPMMRTYGDIDILVSEADYEKSIDILTNYEKRDKLSSMHEFHYHFYYEGIMVEVHKAVSSYERDEADIERYMQNTLDNIQTKSIEHFSFPVLGESYQAISLLLHTKRHYFESALSLKLLCDWAMYIDKIDKNDWNEKLYPLLCELNLSHWADSLSCVCEKYLGIDCSDKINKRYNDDIVTALATEFISDRLKNKEKKEKKSGIIDIISRMNDIAVRDFDIAEKHKVLLPIFWVVIAIRYFYRVKIGLRKGKALANDSYNYKVKTDLLYKIKNQK